MTDTIYYSFDYWKDIIEELDAYADLTDSQSEFIISLIERRPKILSIKQVEWLEDLKERYLP